MLPTRWSKTAAGAIGKPLGMPAVGRQQAAAFRREERGKRKKEVRSAVRGENGWGLERKRGEDREDGVVALRKAEKGRGGSTQHNDQ